MPRPSLLSTLYGKPYQRRLALAWQSFAMWCRKEHGLHPRVLLALPVQLSHVLTEYVEFLFALDSDKFDLARHAVLACQTRIPALKGQLRLAWSALRSWHLSRPSQNRQPMPHVLLQALVMQSCLFGSEASGQSRCRWFLFALLLRVCFEGLLRPGIFS
jgi:hypothetical protein